MAMIPTRDGRDNPWTATATNQNTITINQQGLTVGHAGTIGTATINPLTTATVSTNGYAYLDASRLGDPWGDHPFRKPLTLPESIAKAIEDGKFEEADNADSLYAYLLTDNNYNAIINYADKKLEPGKFYCFDDRTAVDCFSRQAINNEIKNKNNQPFRTLAERVKDLYADPNFKLLKIKILKSDIVYIYDRCVRATEFYVVEEVSASMSISFKVVNVHEATFTRERLFTIDVEVTNNVTMKNFIATIQNDEPDITKEKLVDLVERKIDDYLRMCSTLAIEGDFI